MASPQRKELGTRSEVQVQPREISPDFHNVIVSSPNGRNFAQLLSPFLPLHKLLPNAGAHLHHITLPRSGGAAAGLYLWYSQPVFMTCPPTSGCLGVPARMVYHISTPAHQSRTVFGKRMLRSWNTVVNAIHHKFMY